ncbi:putative mitochondrial protein AtMg00820 [Silene latifolia]|uniref:putative mitochondrial protein AtMg00820 n=1 Tax=Silene latifolia TaxID=37657 RepID=UPI003D77CFF9
MAPATIGNVVQLHLNKPFVGHVSVTSVLDPLTFKEAVQDPKWIAVMNLEVQVLHDNGTWILTDIPKGRQPIGCKWIYKIKYNPDRSVDKARLVVQGFRQMQGIDYDETFAPVAKMSTVRALFALIAMNNWETCKWMWPMPSWM